MSSSRNPKVIKISELVREPSKEEEATKSVTDAEMAKVIEYCKTISKPPPSLRPVETLTNLKPSSSTTTGILGPA
ncbi:hypothetical protein L484_009189 [Morus notabilis]|uniref:Uncharacterized protein n=1 Tax=Morus notabilis TaxID=981085 RepID=W9SUL1_9ROSA|nr:hypothetical protein L484_009183 [Morus notabilis]EXC27864.1 hypothetical protein L484_009186 [Morus notabilis]EXC27867.1 hypothetical protein L484_009189 [Morus notabilis]